MSHSWICPLCDEETGSFTRHTKLGLHVAVAEHILLHEDRAGLRAVDKARLECTDSTCSLGTRKQYDPSAVNMIPKLTEYDKKFLSGIRTKIE